jgi:hypothetical protein
MAFVRECILRAPHWRTYGNATPTHFRSNCQNLTNQSRPFAGSNAPATGNVVGRDALKCPQYATAEPATTVIGIP